MRPFVDSVAGVGRCLGRPGLLERDAENSYHRVSHLLSREATEGIILNQSEGQFDPRIVSAFRKTKALFWEIHQANIDQSIDLNTMN